MNSIEIAPARAEDVPEVLALERAAAEAPHWPEAVYQGIVGVQDGAVVRCLLVARRNGELVGFAVGKMAGDEAELESVVVERAARRGGVGRALCGAVMAWASGASVIELEVRASSAGARELYRRLGFVEVGRRRDYYKAPLEDAVLMRCLKVRGD